MRGRDQNVRASSVDFGRIDRPVSTPPTLDAIFAEDTRRIPAIAASEGASAAYAAFVARRDRFADDDTWRVPSEFDLRSVMRLLDDRGEREAAIEVAKVNTLINPAEWRTWMNLGDLQMRAGKNADAIENYRRSLALDAPTNFNAERLRRAIAEAESRGQPPPGVGTAG